MEKEDGCNAYAEAWQRGEERLFDAAEDRRVNRIEAFYAGMAVMCAVWIVFMLTTRFLPFHFYACS